VAEESIGKKLRQCRWSRMIKEESGFESEACGGGEPISEIEGHERIEAELLERSLGLEGVARGQAEDSGSFGANEVEEGPVAIGGAEGLKSLGERSRGSGIGGKRSSGRGADQSLEQRVEVAEACVECSEVEAGRDESGFGSLQSSIEEGQSLVGGERSESGAVYAGSVGGGEVRGQAGPFGPKAPGE
jgi:hypothetical protein